MQLVRLRPQKMWCCRRGSNPRPPSYQDGALPELSYDNKEKALLKTGREDGAAEWNRTTDTQIFSLLLYQLSYHGMK